MSDNGDIRSMLSVMSGSRQKNEQRWQDLGGKAPYRAVEIDPERTPTLRVHYTNGDIEIFRYSYMTTILYGIDQDAISIHYSAGHAAIYGKNLIALVDMFEGERVKRVVPFNPERHSPPAEGEPLVEVIRWWANDDPPKIGAK